MSVTVKITRNQLNQVTTINFVDTVVKKCRGGSFVQSVVIEGKGVIFLGKAHCSNSIGKFAPVSGGKC